MGFATKYPYGLVISNLANGASAVVESAPNITDHIDSLKRTYLVRNIGYDTPEEAAQEWSIGDKLGALNMYVTGTSAKALARGLFTVDVEAKGLLEAGKGDKIRYTAYANQQSGQNILDDNTPAVLRSNLIAHEAQVGADVSYVSIGTAPPTDDVATETAPASPPAVKSTVWSWLADPTYHYPNGWVLMSSDAENIPGTNVWFVTDRYMYIHEFSP